jgi:hypothetical protein|tara:strand:- start:4 stop:540 length:537 start_codon:yes stop_codon:yes gene_type:complete
VADIVPPQLEREMYTTIVKENFFDNVEDIINISKKLKYYPPKKKDNWPGLRTKSLHETNYDLFCTIVNKVIRNYYTTNECRFNNTSVYFSKIKKGQKGKTHFHYDQNMAIAGVVYLSEGDIKSGTTLFNKDKKKHIIVGNEFNSMVSYDGKKYHGITNLNSFKERLTLNIFIGDIEVL